jgi:nicotinamide-nucleotide amidase
LRHDNISLSEIYLKEAHMLDRLKELVLQLTTAESCTGGGLSYWLTSVPGSSAWFDRGFVTYSNSAKMEMLDVNEETLATEGAVSELAAREMAEGAHMHSEADLSIAITGIAGPEGGTHEKPVGTVWIAWTIPNKATYCKSFLFTGDRQQIRLQAMTSALEQLLEILKH